MKTEIRLIRPTTEPILTNGNFNQYTTGWTANTQVVDSPPVYPNITPTEGIANDLVSITNPTGWTWNNYFMVSDGTATPLSQHVDGIVTGNTYRVSVTAKGYDNPLNSGTTATVWLYGNSGETIITEDGVVEQLITVVPNLIYTGITQTGYTYWTQTGSTTGLTAYEYMSAVTLAVGTVVNGGKIAYILNSGDTGYSSGYTRALIMATGATLQSDWQQTYSFLNATGATIGDGLSNTAKIIAGAGSANIARFCTGWTGGGYNDWYLPNINEMQAIYNNRVALGQTFAYQNYWTSNEESISGAYRCNIAPPFYNFVTTPAASKNGGLRAIPVRMSNITGSTTIYIPATGYTLTTTEYSFTGETYFEITGTTYTTTDSNISINPGDGFAAGVGSIIINTVNSYSTSLDLYDEDTFTLTFQIATSIADKAATYSKTIKIPATANNNAIFNNLFDVSRYISSDLIDTQVFMGKKIPCGIYSDSVELIIGYLELQNVINTNGVSEYECLFYSNLKSIADTIGDKLISGNANMADNLDFSQYNHFHNKTNVQNSWSKVSNSWLNSKGVFYPIIDYANISDGNEYRFENFKPCLYVKEIWDKIFEKAGFTYTSQFLTGSTFKNLLIPHSNSIEEGTLFYEASKYKVGVSTDYGTSSQTHVSNFFERVKFNIFTGGTLTNTTGVTSHGWIFNTGSTLTGPEAEHNWAWTVESSGYFKVAATVRYDIRFLSGANFYPIGPYLVVKIRFMRRRRVGLGSQDEQLGEMITNSHLIQSKWYATPVNIVTGATIAVDVDAVDCFVGDIIWCEISLDSANFYGSNAAITNPRQITIKQTDESSGEITTVSMNVPSKKMNYYLYDTYVYANDALPRKMKQLDFIKSISNKFNLTFAEDKANPKNLIIEPYDNFYQTGYTDWTYKVDMSQPIVFERAPLLLNKDVSLEFKDDSNDALLDIYSTKYAQSFGDRFIKNRYYTESTEKISDQFSSTFLGKFGSTPWYTSKIYKDQDDYILQTPTDGDYNYRVLYRNILTNNNTPVNTTIPIVLTAMLPHPLGSVSGGSYVQYLGTVGPNLFPYAGFLDNPYLPTLDLNYGVANYYMHNGSATPNNLGWTYWSKKLALYLDVNSKFLTVYMRLNNSDISMLDFRKPIKIDNHVYRLQRIVEWVNGNSCKVELVQVQALNVEDYVTTQSIQQVVGLTGGGTGVVLTGTTGTGGGITIEPPVSSPNINLQSRKGNTLFSTLTGDTIMDLDSGYTYQDYTNYFPKGEVGIIIGKGNFISDSDYFIKGSDNVITAKNATMIDSNRNIIESEGVTLIGSHDNIISTGLTSKTILIATTGVTITEDNRVYIQGRPASTLTDVTYVDTVSGATLSESKAYTDMVSGATISESDSKYAAKSGIFIIYMKTEQQYLTSGEYIIGDNYNGTGRTVTIATVDKVNGAMVIINDAFGNASVNNITIHQEGIGGTLATISVNNGFAMLYTDGSNWYGK